MMAPVSSNFNRTDSNVDGSVCLTLTFPPVAAAAARYVPVSIRSGITLNDPPPSLSTPSMTKVFVPAP